MSDSSDIEMQSALPKKTTKKPPKSPTAEILKKQDPKKITTKEMIHQALVDLKSRKGTSMYAIKKYIEEKYQVDVEKINYLIKKYIKTSVELGTIVQTKGIGASGSFKLAAGKDKLEKKKKKPKKETKTTDKTDNSKEKPAKAKPTKKETEKKIDKKPKKVEIAKSAKNKDEKDKPASSKVSKKKDKEKSVKLMKTPSKKRAAMMKRKSIGSIIKPPKMKPKAKV